MINIERNDNPYRNENNQYDKNKIFLQIFAFQFERANRKIKKVRSWYYVSIF